MSRVNDVHAGMWADEQFLDLTAGAKLLYVWSFTNPLCGMSGLYRVARRAIAFELGVTIEQVDKALGELREQRFLVYADGVLFVRSRVKHLRMKTVQIAKSIAADVERLPSDHPVRQAFLAEYGEDREWGEGRLFARLHGESMESPKEPHRTSPEPHVSLSEALGQGQGQGNKTTNSAGRAKPNPPEPDALPDDLPPHLHLPAAAVKAILERVATAKAARPVTLAAVGRALANEPHHDHTRIAAEFEHWWVHGKGSTKQLRDVVQAFRNRLHDLPKQPHAVPPDGSSGPVGIRGYTDAERKALLK